MSFSEPKPANLFSNLPFHEGPYQIATYMDYIDAVLPALKGDQSAEEKAEREDARNKMRAKFSQPGGLGSKFKNLYEKMLKSLALPKGAKDELGI